MLLDLCQISRLWSISLNSASKNEIIEISFAGKSKYLVFQSSIIVLYLVFSILRNKGLDNANCWCDKKGKTKKPLHSL